MNIILTFAAFDAFAKAFEAAEFAATIEAFAQGLEGDGVVVADSVDEHKAFSVVDEVAEIKVTDGDVALQDFFEIGFEVGFELAVEFSSGNEGGQRGG